MVIFHSYVSLPEGNTWGKIINDDFKGPGPLMKEPQDVFSRFFWLMIVASNFLAAT